MNRPLSAMRREITIPILCSIFGVRRETGIKWAKKGIPQKRVHDLAKRFRTMEENMKNMQTQIEEIKGFLVI